VKGFEGGAACGTGRKHPRHGEVVAEVGGGTILGGMEVMVRSTFAFSICCIW